MCTKVVNINCINTMIFNISFIRHQERFTKTFSKNVTQEYKLMQVNLKLKATKKEYGMEFTGCFFNWYPPKKSKYGKPRLGESTLT